MHTKLLRSDSVIDGMSVHKARQNMGYRLANTILQSWSQEFIK